MNYPDIYYRDGTIESPRASHCYLARKTCGCVEAGVLDIPEFRLETADTVAQWIRDGLILERLSIRDPRGAFARCYHKEVRNG